MTQTQYKTLTLDDMKRRRWRTTAALANKHGTIPRDSEVRMIDKHSGLHVEQIEACPHCGVKLLFRNVNPVDIEEIRS